MKKYLFLLLVLMVFGGLIYVTKSRSVRLQNSSDLFQSMPENFHQQLSVIADSLRQSSTKSTEVPGVSLQMQAGGEVELTQRVSSLEELKRMYSDKKFDELEFLISDSKKQIQNQNLVEKANRGILSDIEKNQLVYEMRKQAVLHMLIASHKLNQLKTKNL